MAFYRPALIICCAALAASSGVQAVGFGQVAPTAVLGQPLNVLVPIRLDQGERMFAECVKAEVSAGDSTLPPSQVRVAVIPSSNPAEWTARISTVAPIDEPVIEISVSAGCERRFMRRFTAFADPPVMGLSAPLAVSSAILAPSSSMASRIPRRSAVSRSRAAPASAESPSRSSAGSRATKVATAAVTRPAPAQASSEASAVQRDKQVARLLLDVGGGPMLRMDIEDPVFMPVVAGMAAASGLPGDPEAERLRLLEKTLSDLKRETQASRATETGLKARLAEAESHSRLLPWLIGLLLLAAGVAIWLALRLRSQGAPRDRSDPPASWWNSNAAGTDSVGPAHEPAPSVAGELIDAGDSRPSPLTARAPVMAEVPADTIPMDNHQKTVAFGGAPGESASPFNSIADGAMPTREVSVEELLDLEQQADFFIALGQEEAAVDLLMSHLRSSGGQSPLPYTKLLEIYRRQGDRTAYERIRARFNRRFNAYAPDWDQGPLHGRMLEDYPEVVLRLQGLWPSPLNAMAVLEAMLFRKDERQELFDLPAYKDVLLLYSLARDLYQQGGLDAVDVDLLLPLGDDGSANPPVAGPDAVSKGYDLTAFSLETMSPTPVLPVAPSSPKPEA